MKSCAVCLLLSIFVICVSCVPVVEESIKMSPEIICRQAFVIGDCPATATFWSYDPSKRKCREGCGNNENKFTSQQKCELTCKGIFDGKESNDSEEIKIKAFERVNDPDSNANQPDILL